MRLHILTVLRGSRSGFTLWQGLQCSSWVSMCRHSTKRSFLNPEGDPTAPSVIMGNQQLCRTPHEIRLDGSIFHISIDSSTVYAFTRPGINPGQSRMCVKLFRSCGLQVSRAAGCGLYVLWAVQGGCGGCGAAGFKFSGLRDQRQPY